MSGTVITETNELSRLYGLSIVRIPPHRPNIRIDHPDLVYLTLEGKFRAVADDIAARRERGQPVLVGTGSIEDSERLSALLQQRSIPHHVLNAKHLAAEAMIIAEAGQRSAVTIATNMAGRGTDIT